MNTRKRLNNECVESPSYLQFLTKEKQQPRLSTKKKVIKVKESNTEKRKRIMSDKTCVENPSCLQLFPADKMNYHSIAWTNNRTEKKNIQLNGHISKHLTVKYVDGNVQRSHMCTKR